MRRENVAAFKERAIAFDCETHLIQPGLLAPPLVCASISRFVDGDFTGELLDKDRAREVFVHLLESDAIIVGANIPYDMAVMAVDAAKRGIDLMPLIFKTYREDRVWDIQVAAMLHAIAEDTLGRDPETGKDVGRYSLDTCVRLWLGRDNAKENDEWRLRYAELEHIPIKDWPEKARTYPVDDANNTLETAFAQLPPRWAASPPVIRTLKVIGRPKWHDGIRNVYDLSRQCFYAFASHLGAVWGFHRDRARIEQLRTETVARRRSEILYFVGRGYMRAEPIHEYKRKEKKAFLQALSLVHLSGGHWSGGYEYKANQPILKKAAAESFGAVDACEDCGGAGKVKSAKTKKLINCKTCDSTTYDLRRIDYIATESGGVSSRS